MLKSVGKPGPKESQSPARYSQHGLSLSLLFAGVEPFGEPLLVAPRLLISHSCINVWGKYLDHSGFWGGPVVLPNVESSLALFRLLNYVLHLIVVQFAPDRVYNDAVVLDLEPLMEELQGPILRPQVGISVPTFYFSFE